MGVTEQTRVIRVESRWTVCSAMRGQRGAWKRNRLKRYVDAEALEVGEAGCACDGELVRCPWVTGMLLKVGRTRDDSGLLDGSRDGSIDGWDLRAGEKALMVARKPVRLMRLCKGNVASRTRVDMHQGLPWKRWALRIAGKRNEWWLSGKKLDRTLALLSQGKTHENERDVALCTP